MYTQHSQWKKLQEKLPENNRISTDYSPTESFSQIGNFKVHLDTYNEATDSITTIIIFHGVGGNGRLLSFMAVPLARKGFKVICPDLPSYGLTEYSISPTYQDWIKVGAHLAEEEKQKGQKVFLMGLSAGGMLAYNVACERENIDGIIVTNILDNRKQEVRDYSAKNKFQARYGISILNSMPLFIKRMRIPMRSVCNMNAIVNDKSILEILLDDKLGAGSTVEINFVLSMMNHKPVIEPENFKKIPAIMLHPDDDKWTPTKVSELFFDRIGSKTEKFTLENAGHFPVEYPGIEQLGKQAVEFIERYN